MDRSSLEEAIERELAARQHAVVNRNAFAALFGAFADPVGALGKIFLGRHDAIEAERARLAQGVVIDLLCKIDEALTSAARSASQAGVEVSGLIETHAVNSAHVVGVSIGDSAAPVVFKPRTRIRTSAEGSQSVTGLKIGANRQS